MFDEFSVTTYVKCKFRKYNFRYIVTNKMMITTYIDLSQLICDNLLTISKYSDTLEMKNENNANKQTSVMEGYSEMMNKPLLFVH